VENPKGFPARIHKCLRHILPTILPTAFSKRF
jgi:hypothetical protein